MAAIHFLNPAPLMWDFEHEPRRSDLRERYQIGYTTPSRCARELAAGGPLRQLDLGRQLLVGMARAQRRLLAAGEAEGA